MIAEVDDGHGKAFLLIGVTIDVPEWNIMTRRLDKLNAVRSLDRNRIQRQQRFRTSLAVVISNCSFAVVTLTIMKCEANVAHKYVLCLAVFLDFVQP